MVDFASHDVLLPSAEQKYNKAIVAVMSKLPYNSSKHQIIFRAHLFIFKRSNVMKEYIEEKIKNFEEKYYPKRYLGGLASVDSEIKRMWRDECAKDNQCWRKVETNEDVIRLIDAFESAVYFVEKNVRFGDGHIEDGYRMALAAYRALQGLRKMAEFIDPRPYSQLKFTELSEDEVDGLFDRLNEIAKRMEKQNIRRMMQD